MIFFFTIKTAIAIKKPSEALQRIVFHINRA